MLLRNSLPKDDPKFFAIPCIKLTNCTRWYYMIRMGRLSNSVEKRLRAEHKKRAVELANEFSHIFPDKNADLIHDRPFNAVAMNVPKRRKKKATTEDTKGAKQGKKTQTKDQEEDQTQNKEQEDQREKVD